MNYLKQDWEKRIKCIASHSGNVAFSKHVLMRMKQRKITQSMIFDVLCSGCIKREPEPGIAGDTICRMERYTAGMNIGVCVSLEDECASTCLVITAFLIGERYV